MAVRNGRQTGSLVGVLLVMAVSLIGCASLPRLEGRVASAALTDTAGTPIGLAVADRAAGHAGTSGIHPLQRPREAFAARVVLARAAERSLDVQYYIWHADTTGFLLFEELWNAAGRGVRVRLLLDDNNTGGMDETIAALDSHPGIEVRLFNPFPNRGSRMIGYLSDFSRLNRRMHNKSFTADGQLTIVGGRNIGDEYFAAGDGMVFSDLDVAVAGPVAAEAGSAFDRYWNSVSAYPAELIVGKAAPAAVAKLTEKFAAVRASAEAVAYLEEVRSTPLARTLGGGRVSLAWVPVRLVCDDPAKVLGESGQQDLLTAQFGPVLLSAQREIDIVSPYFVPGKKGTADLVGFARRGIKVRVLTNSLAATDVGAVHAGYVKRRQTLLRGGVKLYELKPDAGLAAAKAVVERRASRAEPRPRGKFRREFRGKLRDEPARQDLRGRPQPRLCRLLQLRPPLRQPQHRDGRAHRRPGACGGALERPRPTGAARGLRGGSGGGRREPGVDRADTGGGEAPRDRAADRFLQGAGHQHHVAAAQREPAVTPPAGGRTRRR